MTGRLGRTARVALALFVVASVAMSGYAPGEGLVGEAQAVHDCNNVDALVFGFSFGYVNEDKCSNNHVDHAVDEVRAAEENQTKVDIYSAASGQKARSEEFEAVYGNYLNDSESIAWMKAEAAIAEAYKNGSTQSEAKVAAREAVSDYYAVKQINLIQSWNSTAKSAMYLRERAEQEANINKYMVQGRDRYSDHKNSPGTGPDYFEITDWNDSAQVTLVNSSTRTSHALLVEDTTYTGDTGKAHVASGEVAIDDGGGGHRYAHKVQVAAPDSNYDHMDYVFYQDYKDRWDRIEAKNTALQDEADLFVDAIWQDLEDGNTDATDILSRNSKMFEYGTATQQNGTYYDSIAAAAGMGLETPDLNETGQMTITDGGGATHDGILHARNAPDNGTWTVGETYDPDNITGPVFMSTTEGETLELTRPFTLDGATDTDGNERSTVDTTRYNYQTANTSELNNKYADLLRLTGQLQERSESVDSESSGGGGSSSSTLPSWLTEKYAGIPLWGYLVGLFAVAIIFRGGG